MGGEKKKAHLGNKRRRIQRDGQPLVVEPVAVIIEETEQQLTEMMTRVHVAALHFRNHLQHANDQAGYRKAADAAIYRLVEAAHEQEMLDDRDEGGHARVEVTPFVEGVDGHNARPVLERDVDSQARLPLDKLDQRDSGV